MNIYPGTDYPNEPIVVVYINGQLVKMLIDAGASGVPVDQGAVNLSQTAFTSQTFAVTYSGGATASGTDAISTVCPTSSNVGCVTMPIAVNSQTSGSNATFFHLQVKSKAILAWNVDKIHKVALMYFAIYIIYGNKIHLIHLTH